MSTREIFRQNLKYYRKQKGLSQEKLSELICFGNTYITEIESRHKFPKPETIDLIAQKLEIEAYELFKPSKKEEDSESKQNNDSESKTNRKEEMTELLCFLQNQINELFSTIQAKT